MPTIQAYPDADGIVRYSMRIASDPNFTDLSELPGVTFSARAIRLNALRRNGVPILIQPELASPGWLTDAFETYQGFQAETGEVTPKLHLYGSFEHPFSEIEPPTSDDVDEYDILVDTEVRYQDPNDPEADEELIRSGTCGYTLIIRKVAEA